MATTATPHPHSNPLCRSPAEGNLFHQKMPAPGIAAGRGHQDSNYPCQRPLRSDIKHHQATTLSTGNTYHHRKTPLTAPLAPDQGEPTREKSFPGLAGGKATEATATSVQRSALRFFSSTNSYAHSTGINILPSFLVHLRRPFRDEPCWRNNATTISVKRRADNCT